MAVVVLAVTGLFAGDIARADPAPIPVRLPVSVGAGPTSDSVVVERGDHLWKISARYLGEQYQRKATNEEITPFWREVIEVNLESLRSGDPDLIYPGEVVRLPASG